MTSFILKIIALTTMIIDHTGAMFPHYFGFEFRVIGRVAFPIFVFLLAEGFRHTRSPQKFLVRLGVFAIISEPFFDLALRTDLRAVEHINLQFLMGNINFFANTNIFYTLFLGGVAICGFNYVIKWKESRNLETIAAGGLIVAALFFAEILTTDYASYGVAFILIMYVITNKKIRLAVMAVMCVSHHNWILEFIFLGQADRLDILHIMMIPATLVPVILAAFYNGKRGPNIKMFFYAAYPAHLAVLFFIAANTRTNEMCNLITTASYFIW